MRAIQIVALVALSGYPSVGAIATPAGAVQCRPGDTRTSNLITWLKKVTTGTGTHSQKDRSTYGIPSATASSVVLVTDEKTCAKAVTALNSVRNTPNRARQVYVVKVGDAFAVEDPADDIDTSSVGIVFDKLFRSNIGGYWL